MRLLDYLTGILSLLALPFIAWWGVNQSPQSARMLEARLQANAVQALQLAGLGWAEVKMDGQTAILTGPAPSQDAVPEAAAVILRSSGAGGLVFGGVSQVQTRVHAADPVWPYVWTAEKQPGGGLILAGHVSSRAARDALLLEAQAIAKGPVVDKMVVAMGAPEGNWQGIAQFAIVQLAELDEGKAELSGTVLTLRGAASDDAARVRLTDATRAVAAPFRGVPLITGAPVWSARLEAGAIVLSGAVPSASDRSALVAVAGKAFSGEVRDEMVVTGSLAPEWIEGAKAGLSHFAAFGSGRMTFDPLINSFAFEGEAPASTLQFLSEDMTRFTGRWLTVIAAGAVVPKAASAAADAGKAQADACVRDLNQMLSSAAVSFQPGGAEFSRQGAPALDRFAALAAGCPALDINVDGDALNQTRAAAIADFLERAGVRRPRIAAIGYGPATGGQGMDTGKGAPQKPPLEFTVREQSER